MNELKKPDLTIHGLLAWLRTMPPDDKYDYASQSKCACAQFLKSQGFRDVWAGGWTVAVDGERHNIPLQIQEAVEDGPYTFGDALARASKIAAR